ncbi:hypothetical protein SCB49_06382 [unidentified eubacterium SCB49]|nr:hypothetical protein SCB49_06382 [unidentified eubacterium SCB49]
MFKTLINLLMLALKVFLAKSIFDVTFQWIFYTIEVREHIWGKFGNSFGFVILDFVLHFWFYFLVCIIAYLILFNFKRIKFWFLYILGCIMIIIVCLEYQNYEFPLKNYYFPSRQVFNYSLIQEIIVYISTLTVMFYLLKRNILKKK